MACKYYFLLCGLFYFILLIESQRKYFKLQWCAFFFLLRIFDEMSESFSPTTSSWRFSPMFLSKSLWLSFTNRKNFSFSLQSLSSYFLLYYFLVRISSIVLNWSNKNRYFILFLLLERKELSFSPWNVMIAVIFR